MIQHPTDEQFTEYIHRTLHDVEREAMDRHLRTCPACRAQLASHEALQRRIRYELLAQPQHAEPSPRMTFAAIRPRLKRHRRITMVKRGSGRLLYSVASLVLLLTLGVGLPALFATIRRPAVDPEVAAHIIPLYEGMAAFVKAVEADPDAPREELLKAHILEPYGDTCWIIHNSQYSSQEYKDLLALTPDIADAAKRLRDAGVEQVVASAIEKAREALPGPIPTVCIWIKPFEGPWPAEAHGVYGWAPGANPASSNRISLMIDLQGDWLEWVPYVVARQYHYINSPVQDFDLLAALVSEGRGHTFAHLLYPDKVSPRVQALTPSQEAQEWELLRPHLDSTDRNFNQRVLWGDNPFLPWYGPTIGYHIVQSYLEKHPYASVEEWTALDADELLAESGYEPGR